MDYDKSIHHNPDAQMWAKFFIDSTKDMSREVFNDEGYMIGWFANAMMAMHDYLYTNEIERLRLSRELHIKLYKNKKKQLDMLREALEMVRDADNDCHLDGLQTIPSPARAKIDSALKETE